jgi:hypothetical protein
VEAELKDIPTGSVVWHWQLMAMRFALEVGTLLSRFVTPLHLNEFLFSGF